MNRKMYKISVMAFLGIATFGYAQQAQQVKPYEGKVGINTAKPSATLEISPNEANAKVGATTNEGIIVPRLSKTRIANIGTPVESTLVYVTDEAISPISAYTGSNDKVARITEKGYYFYNGTEWVKVETDANAIWVKDGENVKLAYPKSDYTIKYLANGGNATYKDTTYPSGSKDDPRVKYDWNILTEMNSFSKTLVNKSDITETTNGFSIARDRNIFKIDQGLSPETTEIASFMNQTFITEDDILEDKSVYNSWNNVEHFGNKKVNWLIGTYSSAALNGLSSLAHRAAGGLFDVVTNSDVATDQLYASFNRVRLNGKGDISRVYGSRVEITRRNSFTTINSNIDKLYLHYVGYNGLGNDNYKGKIAEAYDFYAEAGADVVSKITKQYGFHIGGSNKVNYLQGKLGIGTNEPSEKLDVVGHIKVKNGSATTRITIDSDSNYALNRFSRGGNSRWDVGMEGLTTEAGGNVGSNYYISSFQDDGETAHRRMTILRDSGNVGIGTMTPAEKLEVAGNIKARTFIATNAGSIFPDYVFQKYYTGTSNIKSDYNFQSLSQVEDFVKTNGHLPGYKSAEVIKAQGYVDLMETQLTNVEKIEELYLHLMEKEKEVQDLKRRLETLEKLIK